MSALTGIIVALMLAALTPFATFYTHKYIEQGRRLRAFKRLQSEPLLKVGTVLSRLEFPGRDAPVFPGDCILTKLTPGRVEFTNARGTDVTVFTGREVENLIMIIKTGEEKG